MPKTTAETKTLAAFEKQYGTEKGQRIFYAHLNKKRAEAKKGSKSAKRYLTAMFTTKGGE